MWVGGKKQRCSKHSWQPYSQVGFFHTVPAPAYTIPVLGTGTVFDFGTPWHTADPYRSVMGMYGYYYPKVSIIFVVLNAVFFIFSQVN